MPDAHDDIQRLLDHVGPYTLVMFRVAGLFFTAPLLTSLMLPTRAKAFIAVMFAAAIYPSVPTAALPATTFDVFTLVPLVLLEGAIGFTIGFLASIPLIAMEMAGVLTGQQMGFGLARVYNPEYDADTDLLGQLLFLIALGVFLSARGLETLFVGVLRSFERVPIGGMRVHVLPIESVVGVVHSGLELALRVSAPVAAIVFLLVILFGVLSKTMPQINPMTLAFSIKILCGLGLLLGSAYAIQHATDLSVHHALGEALRWINSLTAPSPP